MNKLDRPETTLFMLMSVDGKISTGDTDVLDVDKDYPKIDGIKEGLQQYYDLEKQTDYWSFNTGKVMAKIGFNEKEKAVEKIPVQFVVLDNKPHLKKKGVEYLCSRGERLFIVTTNKNHPAKQLQETLENLIVLEYGELDFLEIFSRLKTEFGCEKMTIQSGGTMNTKLVRDGLIDHLSLVVAPALIGGKDTATLLDGESLHSVEDLSKIRALELKYCEQLKNSYVNLFYGVDNT